LVVSGVLASLVAAPARVHAQEAATVTCKDGSTSKAGKGACSHHGGVAKAPAPAAPAPSAKAATPAAKAPAPASPPPRNDNAVPPAATQRAPAPTRSTPPPAATPGKPTAKCKDGSLSYSTHHSGACSHHGGVAQWLDGS
jgi:pyruvate/2-oxoglutarate dehydrogenase complex dihydrolipoamide acyltransferase (E2) component